MTARNSEREPEFEFDPEIERTARQRQKETKLRREAEKKKEMAEDHPRLLNNQPRENQEVGRLGMEDEDDGRAIGDYTLQNLNRLHNSIRKPEIGATHFELKPVMFNMIDKMGQFHGLQNENPHVHLSNFLAITDSFKFNNVDDDVLRLKLFPYSLDGRAHEWLRTQPHQSIGTWNDLANAFLNKFFPPGKMVKYRNEILSFQQQEGESLFAAWERFKKLLLAYPCHGLRPVAQILTFYEGLGEHTQTLVDAAAGGSLTTKSYTEAKALLEMMASNHSGRESMKKISGMHSIDQMNVLSAQVTAMQKQLQSLNMNMNANINSIGIQGPCDWCHDLHNSDQCPSNPESICYVDNLNRNNNPYSNTYNSGWRNHPNFSWGGNQGNSAPMQRPMAQSGMQFQHRPPPPQDKKPSLEEATRRTSE